MLPTFVIGLREGLEAALIVSIIATFLRRNGVALRAMWVGVGAAVVLSIAVGVVLQVVETSLPQRQQEGMETVIGAIAVVFVTGMILWMRTHARFMKRELETAAEAALGDGTAKALAVMAFIAVLREGFETSVFLLSTFQASTSTLTPAVGAVLGIVAAVAIGVGIYSGGVRLNLTRFFKYTGVFLVFVAAGLVLNALRTGHEAGWINVGQGTTLDLHWLAPNGSIRTALISGVLGIPADPRVIEVLGWLLYLVPVLALTLWPASWMPSVRVQPRLRLAAAVVMVVAAVVLFVSVSYPTDTVPTTAPLKQRGSATVAIDGESGTLSLSRGGSPVVVPLGSPEPGSGSADTRWALADDADQQLTADLPTRLSLARLLTYTGHRVPVGLDATRNPGPYDASWTLKGQATVLTRDGGLISGTGQGTLVLALSGGGLTSTRVVTIDDPSSVTRALSWTISADYTSATSAALADQRIVRNDRELWKHWFPVVLLVGAALLVVTTLRRGRSSRPAASTTNEPAASSPLAHTSPR